MLTLKYRNDRHLFLAVSFLLWFPHFIYVPILSPYMESLGVSYTFIGVILGSYGLMQLLFRLPIGVVSDLIKLRKPFIIFGMLSSVLSCFIFSVTDHLGLILLARCLAGIAASSWVVFTVLYASYFGKEEVHRAMSSISFIVVLAQFLGMSLSGYIVNEWGWQAPFWLGGIMSIIGMILSFFIVEGKEEIAKAPVTLKDLTSVTKESLLLKVSLLSILAHSIIFTTMFGFIPAYALKIGFQTNELSLIVFSFMIPHALASLFMGKVFVPLFGEWRLMKFAFFLASFFTLVTPLVETKGLLCIIQAVNGFSLGLIFPLLLGIAVESVAHEKRATAMGVYQALYAIGIFAGPFLTGMLISFRGLEEGFYFTGILGAVATLLIVYWNKQAGSSKEFGLNEKTG